MMDVSGTHLNSPVDDHEPSPAMIRYIHDVVSDRYWIEMDGWFVDQLKAWLQAQGTVVQWEEEGIHGIMADWQTFRLLMRQLATLCGVELVPAMNQGEEILRAAVEHLHRRMRHGTHKQ